MKQAHARAQHTMRKKDREAAIAGERFVAAALRFARLSLHHQRRTAAEADMVKEYVAAMRAEGLPLGGGA